MFYSTSNDDFCQDSHVQSELDDKFAPKKRASLILAESYRRLGMDSRADLVKSCATYTEWAKPLSTATAPPPASGARTVGGRDNGETWKLHVANFCKDRLCPVCAWRRTVKIFGQVSSVMNVIGSDYDFLFLTLTVPNCKGSDLNSTIDKLLKSFENLRHDKRWKNAVCGFFRVLEITHNTDLYACRIVKTRSGKKRKITITDDNALPLPNPSYDTYHPHFHIILAVRKSYFKSRDYLSHDEWLDMWRKATKDSSITQVDIRKCKSKSEISEGEEAVRSLESAVAEAAKYSVKSGDYLGKYKDGELVKPFPNKVMDDAVFWLSGALANRQLCAFGGCFLEARRKLNQDDANDGDLVHVEDNKIRADVGYMIVRYSWSSGAYKFTERSIKMPSVDLLVDDDTGEILD
jgi:plasmid rolling circle replication initiator protein Rep